MGGNPSSDSADESNKLMREQAEQQEAERKRKTKSVYTDIFNSLRSQGKMRFEPVGGSDDEDDVKNPGLQPANSMEGTGDS